MEGLKNALIIELPAHVSPEGLKGIFVHLKKAGRQRPLVLDFKRVESIKPAEIEILDWIRRSFSNVEFQNSRDYFAAAADYNKNKSQDSMEPEAGSLPAKEIKTTKGYIQRTGVGIKNFFCFLSDTLVFTARYLRKPEGIYPGEIVRQFDFMAYRSFPIVTLITFLVGVTISLTSAAQLKLFGADLYLADFVGIAMFRELVPLMVGVILAGKIGAAITAEIASMTVLEEVDALKTMGIVPEKYLMVPRFLAITLSMPLLVGLADIVGILGGILVAQTALGIPPGVFIGQMFKVVFLNDFLIGLIKSLTFGWAVVISSGFKGFFVKRSAEEVGRATTESVVLSISLIIVLDCIYALVLYG